MKVRELIEALEKCNPEDEFVITLPPNWFREEDTRDSNIWKKKGWTFDSADYILHVKEYNFVCVCPLENHPFGEGGK